MPLRREKEIMVEITDATEFQAREVLSKTYDTSLFSSLAIRDTNTHNSDIADCRIYNLVTFFIINTLNKPVTVQIKGNYRWLLADGSLDTASIYGFPLDVGASFVVAPNEPGAKVIAASVDGILECMFIACSCSDAPTSGVLSARALKKYID